MKRTVALAACAAFLAGVTPRVNAEPLVDVTVQNGWSRPAIDTAVVYAVVRNGGATPLLLVGASSQVAQSAELHQSMSMSAGKMDGAAMSAMGMQPVARLEIPPHGTLTLKPGSYHLMLLGLRQPLAAGQRFMVTLLFAGGVSKTFLVQVENRGF